MKTETIEQFGDRAGKKLVLDAKKHVFNITNHVKADHKRKLDTLKNEVTEVFTDSFGSRKIYAKNYSGAKGCNCSNEAEPVPYVRQLRMHRRNRKHKRVEKEISQYIRTEEDIKRLDPVVLTNKVELSEADKEVLRLPDCFAPTPGAPVDVFDQAIGTHEWAERMRWRYFWNKEKTEEEIENEEP